MGAYADGIHRISNTSGRTAILVHVYGPRQGVFDGRDYDPTREFVCDRLEPDDPRAYPALQRAGQAWAASGSF